MTQRTNLRTGGQILVDALKIHGVDMAFCVPGESYLAVLDALYDAQGDIRLITCRHESGASFMAEAYGKLTGRPGICFVTRAPGACNASIGAHTALQDSSPMIMFVGQVARDQQDREAFQEVDYRRMYGELAKWVGQVENPARLPEYISHAFHVAVSGRPGPVVLALPEDMLTETAETADTGPYTVVRPNPGAAQLDEMRRLLADAERPMMIVGGGGWSARAATDIVGFAEANDIPTGVAFRCQDLFDNDHANYAGDIGIGLNPPLARRLRESDLLLVVGARLGEMTSQGYTLPAPPNAPQTLVHVHADAGELGRVYQADLPIASGMAEFAAAARALDPVDAAARRDWAKAARDDYLAGLEPGPTPGPVDMALIIAALSARVAPDAIITNDAGNFSGWAQRFLPLHALPQPARPDQRRDGLWRAGGGRRQGGLPRPDGDLLRRRRRHADDRPGDRHRPAARHRAGHHRGQQRHVRHDPHAPEAGLPGAGPWHGARQPRLRGAGPGLWRPWRDGREDRGLRAGARPRARRRTLRRHRAAHRPRGDHHAHDARRDPRKGAGVTPRLSKTAVSSRRPQTL